MAALLCTLLLLPLLMLCGKKRGNDKKEKAKPTDVKNSTPPDGKNQTSPGNDNDNDQQATETKGGAHPDDKHEETTDEPQQSPSDISHISVPEPSFDDSAKTAQGEDDHDKSGSTQPSQDDKERAKRKKQDRLKKLFDHTQTQPSMPPEKK